MFQQFFFALVAVKGREGCNHEIYLFGIVDKVFHIEDPEYFLSPFLLVLVQPLQLVDQVHEVLFAAKLLVTDPAVLFIGIHIGRQL